MQLQTKALYNLLKLHAEEGGVTDYQPWQVEDLRILSEEKIFARLHKLGVDIDKERFSLFAEQCDTPEDLSEVLMEESKSKEILDQGFLLIFELWRRFFPERQSLSIFCDELDFLIGKYLDNSLDSDELIQDALANLEEILDANVDSGGEPTEVFEAFLQFCAHDIEAFLYEYIAEQINAGNELYASELIEGFYPYLSNLKWFDFLRVRLLSTSDMAEANAIIEHIYKEVAAAPDYTLQWELLKFLVQEGDVELFKKIAFVTIPSIETEEKFQQLLSLVAEFYGRLDEEKKENEILLLIEKRKNLSPQTKVSIADSDLLQLKTLLKTN